MGVSLQPKSPNPCSQLCQMLVFQHFAREPCCVVSTKVGQSIWKILTQHLDLFTSPMSDWEEQLVSNQAASHLVDCVRTGLKTCRERPLVEETVRLNPVLNCVRRGTHNFDRQNVRNTQ